MSIVIVATVMFMNLRRLFVQFLFGQLAFFAFTAPLPWINPSSLSEVPTTAALLRYSIFPRLLLSSF